MSVGLELIVIVLGGKMCVFLMKGGVGGNIEFVLWF